MRVGGRKAGPQQFVYDREKNNMANKNYAEWPGTEDEKSNFLEAIYRQCECVVENDVITQVCRPHLLLTPNKENFEFWEHLVYGKRLWGKRGKEFRLQEFGPQKSVEKGLPYRMGWNT